MPVVRDSKGRIVPGTGSVLNPEGGRARSSNAVRALLGLARERAAGTVTRLVDSANDGVALAAARLVLEASAQLDAIRAGTATPDGESLWDYMSASERRRVEAVFRRAGDRRRRGKKPPNQKQQPGLLTVIPQAAQPEALPPAPSVDELVVPLDATDAADAAPAPAVAGGAE